MADSGYYDSRGNWVPSTKGRPVDQATLDKEKFQDTSPLVAASKAAAKKRADAEAAKKKASSQAKAVEAKP